MNKKISIFKDRLAGMQEQAKAAMIEYNTRVQTIPDGIYIGRETCEIRETKNTGRLMVSRKFVPEDGEYASIPTYDNIVFQDNEIGWQILRRWIECHGIAWPDDESLIEDIINDIDAMAPRVRFQVKTSKSKTDDRVFTNITVLEVFETSTIGVKKEKIKTEKLFNRQALLDFAASQGIDDINETMPDNAIINALSGYRYQRAELTKEEIALIVSLGLEKNIK